VVVGDPFVRREDQGQVDGCGHLEGPLRVDGGGGGADGDRYDVLRRTRPALLRVAAELLLKATDGDRLDAVIDGQTDW
jgi:hypothetical protein